MSWRRRLFGLAAGLLGLALLAGGAAAWWLQRWWTTPYRGYPTPEQRVTIEAGAGARQILAQLATAGVLTHPELARIYLSRRLGSPTLKAGTYLFREPLTPPQVLAKLVRGEVEMLAVTLIEGLTLAETADRLAAAGFGDREAFLTLFRRGDWIADLDPQATDLEGYLYPDTYQFARGVGAETVARTLVDTFRARWKSTLAPLLPVGTVSPRAVVTLASIVEKEARLAAERPVIAGVYTNRLRQGVALYADPTVIFALTRAGRYDGNLRRPDLAFDSPYNTYRYPGLPPGPICSPGLGSLAAAAAPAEVPYFYFVSRNDGSHVFATTLAEHNRNVERWQRQYWRDRWAEERRTAASGERGSGGTAHD